MTTSKQAHARQLLEFALADGDWHFSRPLAARICQTVGCTVKTVTRAAQDLGVESRRRRESTPATDWRLPRSTSTSTAEPERARAA